MKKSRRRRSFLIIFPFCSLFIFLVLFSFSFYRIFLLKNEREKPSDYYTRKVDHYRYLELNPSSNQSVSQGIASFYHQGIEERDFLMYSSSKYDILISPFENDEYECTGTCYCENRGIIDDEERRSTKSNSLSRSIVFLVSAVSSVVAYSKASEYFSSECHNEIGSTCHPSDEVRSELHTCEVMFLSDDSDDDTDFPVVDAKPKIHHRRKQKFICQGRCLGKKLSIQKLRKMVKDYGCGELRLEGVVEIVSGRLRVTTTVRQKFHLEQLFPYCKQESMESISYIPLDTRIPQYRQLSLCTGGRKNKTIKCYRIKKGLKK